MIFYSTMLLASYCQLLRLHQNTSKSEINEIYVRLAEVVNGVCKCEPVCINNYCAAP